MPPNAHATFPGLTLRHTIRMAQARQAGTLIAVSRTGVVAVTDDTPLEAAVDVVAQLGQRLHDAVIAGTGDARLTPVTYVHLHGQEAVEFLASGRSGRPRRGHGRRSPGVGSGGADLRDGPGRLPPDARQGTPMMTAAETVVIELTKAELETIRAALACQLPHVPGGPWPLSPDIRDVLTVQGALQRQTRP
jgi:hypothetical protein